MLRGARLWRVRYAAFTLLFDYAGVFDYAILIFRATCRHASLFERYFAHTAFFFFFDGYRHDA